MSNSSTTETISKPEQITDDKHQNNTRIPKKTTSLAMVATMGIVAMISGLLVVFTWQITLEPIRENQRIMIEKAIFKVIPGSQQRQSYRLTDNGLILEAGEKTRQKSTSKTDLQFYAAYDNQGQLKGIAVEGAAQGYADMVQLLYGYEPQCQCIRGFSIIKMAETPGLGDKILTDENFLANFKALDARVNQNQTALINNIITVKHGSKKNPWEIDAISGATITSKAVGKAINLSAAQLLPRIQPYIKQLSMHKTTSASKQSLSDPVSAKNLNTKTQE